MYIKLTNNTPETYSIGQLYRDNPQVSFPKIPSEQCLAEYSVFAIRPTSPPDCTSEETTEDAGFIQSEDGSWEQAWLVRPLNEQEIVDLKTEKDEQHRQAYQQEADPLFFKWQRGEATQQQWLDKVTEIKSRT